MERKNSIKVCVTGAAGYIGSWLVKKLLERGYSVHATLRNLEDESKVGILRSLPNAETKLVLFQADLCNPREFELAIEGCEFVLHAASPMPADLGKTKDQGQVAVEGAKRIADSCLRSQSVKRLIYTASVTATSPLMEDGKSFKSTIDESCWTPIHVQFANSNEFSMMDYTICKTLTEKALLGYNDDSMLEVVTLACGSVGGETITPQPPLSAELLVSQATSNLLGYKHCLRYLEEILDSIPLVHVDDVVEAHIFAMENPSMKGRFICAVANPTSRELAAFLQQHYPQYPIDERLRGEPGNGTSCDSLKLRKMGFEFKYDVKSIIDDCLKCLTRFGVLSP